MFKHQTTLRLRDTDAAGIIYFPNLLHLAQETFEVFLEDGQLHIGKLIAEGDYLFPVVHVEADYQGRMIAGQPLQIVLSLKQRGCSSFTLQSDFSDAQCHALGTARITHVTVSRATGRSTPIPEHMQKILSRLE